MFGSLKTHSLKTVGCLGHVGAALTQRIHTHAHAHSHPAFSLQGMKVSCTHFQCSAGAFSYLRDHFSHNFSVDMSHQILSLNINLMLVS